MILILAKKQKAHENIYNWFNKNKYKEEEKIVFAKFSGDGIIVAIDLVAVEF